MQRQVPYGGGSMNAYANALAASNALSVASGTSACGPAGGPGVFAGARYPADSLGNSVQPYENPLQPYDDQGWGVPFTQSPTFAPPIYVNVESARRDMALYPDPANFSMQLPRPIEGIRSIELVELITPTLTNALLAPANDYFFLYNGLKRDDDTFAPQPLVKLYDTLAMATPQTAPTRVHAITKIKDPTTPQYPEYTGPDVTQKADTRYKAGAGAAAVMYPYPDFAANSFGKFVYDSARPVQYWERKGVRKCFFFKPEHGQLEKLDFCLVDREGRLYDMLGDSPVGDWSATLLITAKQH